MGQKKHQQSSSTEKTKAAPFLGSNTTVDPLLASLFESSAGPVKTPQRHYEPYKASRERAAELQAQNVEELEEQSENGDEVDEDMEDVGEQEDEESLAARPRGSNDTAGRKRKRGGAGDDLEESYMRKIAKEEAREEEKRRAEKESKRRKVVESEDDEGSSSSSEDGEEDDSDTAEEDDDINSPPPLHESLSGSTESAALDKSNRTVFLGNVSTEAIKSKSAKKTLMAHLSSFFPSLPESGTAHAVESIRFRSTAFSSTAVPKRAAFAKKELMDKTTRSTNAYAVYSTTAAARRAPAALNGSIVLDRHLRVDSVAHPLAVDNKRCVFVGNLGFVDEEINEDDDNNDDEDGKKSKKKKTTPPSDVEEGLWRIFNTHTGPSTSTSTSSSSSKGKKNPIKNVESVRVVRDPTTRIGKGFAYVQFHNENHVETALQLDRKKFPPLLPRKLRVVHAKRVGKKRDLTGPGPGPASQGRANGNGTKTTKKDQGSLQGRASGLLGRAGAAKLRSASTNGGGAGTGANSTPVVFEGYRATADTPKFKVKTKSRGASGGGGGKKGRRVGKPKTRSSRRGAAFKAQGGKKNVG